jgi:hypothetical protein
MCRRLLNRFSLQNVIVHQQQQGDPADSTLKSRQL